jgi:hypothetical protein
VNAAIVKAVKSLARALDFGERNGKTFLPVKTKSLSEMNRQESNRVTRDRNPNLWLGGRGAGELATDQSANRQHHYELAYLPPCHWSI